MQFWMGTREITGCLGVEGLPGGFLLAQGLKLMKMKPKNIPAQMSFQMRDRKETESKGFFVHVSMV